MDRKAVAAALLPALMLYACDRAIAPPEPGANATLEAANLDGTPGVDAVPSPPPPADGSRDAANDGYPDLTPPVLTPQAERTERGARNVLLSFARAIELEEFDQAWAMLSPGDRAKWSKLEFRQRFADLGEITVAAPAGRMEGAAGTSYYTAPVTITANDREGRPIRYEGEAVLRRVNDVDGASAAQRSWGFDRLTLDWTH